MNEELKTKLARYMPLAVVVRIEDGKVQGRVEHSFSMDWDANRVRVFWSGKAYSILGEHMLDGTKDAKHNMNQYDLKQFLFDSLSEDCPIEMDWEGWLADLARDPGDKFKKRNAKFTVKPHGIWQLRALAAERSVEKLQPQLETLRTSRDEAWEKLNKRATDEGERQW